MDAHPISPVVYTTFQPLTIASALTTFSPPALLNPIILDNDDANAEAQFENPRPSLWSCCFGGCCSTDALAFPVHVAAKLDRMAYCPGETVNVALKVAHMPGSKVPVVGFSAMLERDVEYVAEGQ